jgi:hypothetical protein
MKGGSWNHRVIDVTVENEGDPLFELREVYYIDGAPIGHGEPSVMSETMEGLVEVIDRMKEALERPVLKPEDFRGEVR